MVIGLIELLLVVLLEVEFFFLLSFFFPFSCIIFFSKETRTHSPLSPYLGVGGLIIFALLVVFCLRKRRNDKFAIAENIDPAMVPHIQKSQPGSEGNR